MTGKRQDRNNQVSPHHPVVNENDERLPHFEGDQRHFRNCEDMRAMEDFTPIDLKDIGQNQQNDRYGYDDPDYEEEAPGKNPEDARFENSNQKSPAQAQFEQDTPLTSNDDRAPLTTDVIFY